MRACSWGCYYFDFPIVRIRDGIATGRHGRHQRPSALAVEGSRVALFGGYGPRPTPPELDVDRAEPTGEYQIVLPDGRPLPTGTQVTGRGRRLHFLTDASWYQLDARYPEMV